jgi:hypothetical protein
MSDTTSVESSYDGSVSSSEDFSSDESVSMNEQNFDTGEAGSNVSVEDWSRRQKIIGRPPKRKRAVDEENVAVPPVTCTKGCKSMCVSKIAEEHRLYCYRLFQQIKLKDNASRDVFIAACNTKRLGADKLRGNWMLFPTNTVVCRGYLASALGVSPRFLSDALDRVLNRQAGFDGRAPPKNKPLNQDVESLVTAHIEAFPKNEVHYGNERDQKRRWRYLEDATLSYRAMHRMYLKEVGSKPVSYATYRRLCIARRVRTGRIHKDLCMRCRAGNKFGKGDDDKIREKRDAHVAAAAAALDGYRADREIDSDEHYCVTADLMSNVLLPRHHEAQLYYNSKLTQRVFGIIRTRKGQIDRQGSSIVSWSELDGSRGSSEIGTCLFKWGVSLPVTAKHVILWQDRCPGQNDNRYVRLALTALKTRRPELRIVLKFFESGHSFNDADRAFGLLSRNLPGELYVPSHVDAAVEKLGFSLRSVQDVKEWFDWKSLAIGLNYQKSADGKTSEYRVWEFARDRLLGWESHADFDGGKDPGYVLEYSALKEESFDTFCKAVEQDKLLLSYPDVDHITITAAKLESLERVRNYGMLISSATESEDAVDYTSYPIWKVVFANSPEMDPKGAYGDFLVELGGENGDHRRERARGRPPGSSRARGRPAGPSRGAKRGRRG